MAQSTRFDNISRAPLKRFWVFNPDSSGAVNDRFLELLGPGARQRFQYFPMPFSSAISSLRREFSG